MISVEALLSRLQKVRRAGPNHWKACCPAHEDRSPSFDVKVDATGKIWIKCWATCTKEACLDALGLRWSDLDPAGKRVTPPELRGDVLEARHLVAAARGMKKRGERFSDADKAAYAKALRILNAAGVAA